MCPSGPIRRRKPGSSSCAHPARIPSASRPSSRPSATAFVSTHRSAENRNGGRPPPLPGRDVPLVATVPLVVVLLLDVVVLRIVVVLLVSLRRRYLSLGLRLRLRRSG